MNVLIMYSCSIAVSWAQSFDFFRFFSCDHLVDNLSLLIYFFLYPYLYCAMCILFINGVLSSNLIIKQEKEREQRRGRCPRCGWHSRSLSTASRRILVV